MAMVAPKRRCQLVWRNWQNWDGSLWQRQWWDLRHLLLCGTGNDWRPILGTSVDTRILPPPLSAKESLLLLSQWVRLPRDDLHIMHATNSWLQPGKVNQALGPDCDDSPHSIRVSPLDLGIAPYLAVLFGPQKADQDHQTRKSNKRGHRLLMRIRHRTMSCPHRKKFL